MIKVEIYRRYIGTGYIRSADDLLKVFTTLEIFSWESFLLQNKPAGDKYGEAINIPEIRPD